MAISYTLISRASENFYGIRAQVLKNLSCSFCIQVTSLPHLKSKPWRSVQPALSPQEEDVWSYGGLSWWFLSSPVHTRRAKLPVQDGTFQEESSPLSLKLASWRDEERWNLWRCELKKWSWTSGGVVGWRFNISSPSKEHDQLQRRHKELALVPCL